jgi:hypothetical protein
MRMRGMVHTYSVSYAQTAGHQVYQEIAAVTKNSYENKYSVHVTVNTKKEPR